MVKTDPNKLRLFPISSRYQHPVRGLAEPGKTKLRIKTKRKQPQKLYVLVLCMLHDKKHPPSSVHDEI